MLKQLTEASGVSGNETEIRTLLFEQLKEYHPTIDTMGNVIVHKPGNGKKVMVCAHMDEVGLIVTDITEQGYLKFESVGGIDSRILCGKRVFVGENRHAGIIGMKAVHLQSKEERKTPVKEKNLVIDIGAKDKAEAESVVSLGDYITFDSDYVEFGSHKVKAKALDNRVGCAILLELIQNDYPFDFYAVFTVQEEVGTRGAKTAANQILPDYALILEGTTCSDTYGTPPHLTVTHLGDGAAVPIMDRSAILDSEMVSAIVQIAEREQIPYQYKRTTAGGTDAGAVHLAGTGVRTAILAVPIRYIHSPASVMDVRDFDSTRRLAAAFLSELGESTWTC